MPEFGLHVTDCETGSTANTFTTLLGLKFANTTGHRARLRRLVVGGDAGAPQDKQVDIRLRRSDNTTDGTSTAVGTTTIGKKDSGSVASNVAAIGQTYTAEPTTKETGYLAGGSLNARGTLVLEWNEVDAPVWGPNQTLLIEGAPGEATAVRLGVTAEWEEF